MLLNLSLLHLCRTTITTAVGRAFQGVSQGEEGRGKGRGSFALLDHPMLILNCECSQTIQWITYACHCSKTNMKKKQPADCSAPASLSAQRHI